MPEPEFLSIDLSTQSLTYLVSPTNFTNSISLPQIQNGSGGGQYPVEEWIKAIEEMLRQLQARKEGTSGIVAIGGCAQQHGSIWHSQKSLGLLQNLDATKGLREQLVPDAFQIPEATTWMDSTSSKQCRELEEKYGMAELARRTGSRAHERFTGPQIRKIKHTRPEDYARTARISLVSSLVTTLLTQSYTAIEISDATGMNLVDIETQQWNQELLDFCGGAELRDKLGEEPIKGGTVVGKIGKYFVDKYGFNPDCVVTAMTGDNSASVVQLAKKDDVVISLGTSSTALIVSELPLCTSPDYHVLLHPLEGYIGMLCYKNGALSRERVMRTLSPPDWNTFSRCLADTPAGNDGHLGFYFDHPEIIPNGIRGVFRFINQNLVDSFPSMKHDVRAIVESQFMSIKSRLRKMCTDDSSQRVIATGGGSVNSAILQVLSDVLKLPVYVLDNSASAVLGGIVLAQEGFASQRDAQGKLWKSQAPQLSRVALPNERHGLIYDDLLEIFDSFELKAMEAYAVRQMSPNTIVR